MVMGTGRFMQNKEDAHSEQNTDHVIREQF